MSIALLLKRVIAVALSVVAILFLALLVLLVLDSASAWTKGRAFAHILQNAREIQLIEFARTPSGKEFIYRRVPLSAEDDRLLAQIFTHWIAPSGRKIQQCAFVPHHRIEVTLADGTRWSLEICFSCRDFRVKGGDICPLPQIWAISLRRLFESKGMPERNEQDYREVADELGIQLQEFQEPLRSGLPEPLPGASGGNTLGGGVGK